MVTVLSLINGSIFTSIAILHLYWAFGGKWVGASVIPSKVNSELAFAPTKFATSIVAMGVLIFAIISFVNSCAIKIPFLTTINWFITLLFFIRFIGDFNYVGITKKIKGTEFSRNDSLFYSPLCLLISINSLIQSIN